MSPGSASLSQEKQTNLPQMGWDGAGRARPGRGKGPRCSLGTLTAVGFIGAILTVRVAITAPQLEDTVTVATGELVGLTGWSGFWVDQAGVSQRPSRAQLPRPLCPPPPPDAILTTVQLITAVLAVLLPIADIVLGDALPAAARGLMGPTGQGPGCLGEQRLGSRGDW